jgi:uncharacterized protein (TIGR02145 family)
MMESQRREQIGGFVKNNKAFFMGTIGLLGITFLLTGESCNKSSPTSSYNNTTTPSGTVTDADGNIYHTVKIGNQTWTVENLRTTKYNDGTDIHHIMSNSMWSTDTGGAYCYYNNTTNADSIIKFGALYNWYAVNTKKLAPPNWHIPASAEWDTLQKYLIATGFNWDGTMDSDKTAKSLAAKTDWDTSSISGEIGNDLSKNNRTGFSALPGGNRDYSGAFYSIGKYAVWYCSSDWNRLLSYDEGGFDFSDCGGQHCGYSVRLIQD